jgi:alpha-glucosidase
MPESVFLAGDPDWWRNAVVYQVYPRSFADSNGDGLGDIRGVTSRVDYLANLGVDAVWLSPFYPSPLADGGYDVADYRDVDPRLGTLDDVDTMIAACHEQGIRVFVDIVPNHSSDQHAWFRAALQSHPGSPERARYIFREGRGESGEIPPNDWASHFGPTGWTRTTNPDGTPGEWYLHLFAPEQPDFNWDNPEVVEDFQKTIRFWSDRGVDGFRIDVAHALTKNMSEPYPSYPTGASYELEGIPSDGSHHLFDRDETIEIYRGWRQIFNSYDPPRVAVAEAGVPIDRLNRYASSETLGQSFNFALFNTPWSAQEYKSIIASSLSQATAHGSSSTWALSNHDVVRHATRFGLPEGTDLNDWLLTDGTKPELNRELGVGRARAVTMMLLALPGSTYLYQGEELGLFEVADLPAQTLQDPIWERSEHVRKGRDGCRVPLPWTSDGSTFGFGSDGSHLPQPAWFGALSVASQDGVAGSTLEMYRDALRLRKSLNHSEHLAWVDSSRDVLHFARADGWHNLTNFGSEALALPAGEVILSSSPLAGKELPANTTVWIRV